MDRALPSRKYATIAFGRCCGAASVARRSGCGACLVSTVRLRGGLARPEATDCVSATDTGKPLFLREQVTPSPSCVHFRCISGLGISRHPRNPSCARAVLSMSHSEANDAPFRVVLSAPSLASRNANADEKIRLSHRAETRRCVMPFWCRPLQGVAPPYGRLGQSSRATIGSRRFHPLRKAPYRSDGSMLLTMRAHSAGPLPIPKCRSAVVTTLPAPPSALPLVYSDISNCQPMTVTTVVRNLDAGTLAAAVSARERNDQRAISRDRAPAIPGAVQPGRQQQCS